MIEKILFVGPVANTGGPAIKNRILVEYLKKKTSVRVWNTYNQSVKARIGAIFSILFARQNYIIIGVGRKGRNLLYPLLLLRSRISSVHYSCIIIGGQVQKSSNTMASIQAMKQADIVTVETKGLKSQMEKVFQMRNLHWMPNYKELPSEGEFLISDDKYDNETLHFIFLSSLRNKKGVRTLMNAFIETRKEGYSLTLDFYGPLREDFDMDLLEQMEKTDGVCYKGEIKNEYVLKTLKEYHVFVFPTEHPTEGFPAVLVEAQAAGLPVIASDINYNSEIIENNVNGYIYEHGNEKKLSELLKYCCINRTELKRIAECNLKNVRQYDAHYVLEKYFQILCDKGWIL